MAKVRMSASQQRQEDRLAETKPFQRTALRQAPRTPDTPEEAAIRARLKARNSANKATLTEMNNQR